MSQRALPVSSFADLLHVHYRLENGDELASYQLALLGYEKSVATTDGIEELSGVFKEPPAKGSGETEKKTEPSGTDPIPKGPATGLRLPVIAQRKLSQREESIEVSRQPVEDNDRAFEISPSPHYLPPEPWKKTWPRLKPLLGRRQSGSRPDLEAITATLAKGRPLVRIPCEDVVSLYAGTWIYIDYASPADWLSIDAQRVAERIRQWLGFGTRGRLIDLPQGPSGVWYDVDKVSGASEKPRSLRSTIEFPDLPLPAAGTPVLVITCLGASSSRVRWRQFWHKALRHGLHPVFMSPTAPDGFSVLGWGKPGGASELSPVDVMLATASLSSWVTPPMVRRWRLAIEGACLEDELKFWLHADTVTVEGQGGAVRREAREKHLAAFRNLPLSQRNALLDPTFAVLDAHDPGLRHGVAKAAAALNPDWAAGEGKARVSDAESWWASAANTIASGDKKSAFAEWAHHYGEHHQYTFAARPDPTVSRALTAAYRQLPSSVYEKFPAGMTPADRLALSAESSEIVARQLVQIGDELKLQPVSEGITRYSPGVVIAALEPCADLAVIETGGRSYDLGHSRTLPLPDDVFIVSTSAETVLIEWQDQPAWTKGFSSDSQGTHLELGSGEQLSYPSAGQVGPLSRELSVGKSDWAERFSIDEYGLKAEVVVNDHSFVMRWCGPGTFRMGSPDNEPERSDNEQRHEVSLTRGFWLAESACTQKLWHSVLGDRPARFEGDDLPVEKVSWGRITEEFVPALNELIPGLGARLPSEAEWEYACRAGTSTPFSFGEELSPGKANYNGNYPYNEQPKGEYREQTVPVKTFAPNAWGFYQMHGNVWEWCGDAMREYGAESVTDPWGGNGSVRVLRGGSWSYGGRLLRSADRFAFPSVNAYSNFGFRLSRGPASWQAEPDGEDVRGTRADGAGNVKRAFEKVREKLSGRFKGRD